MPWGPLASAKNLVVIALELYSDRHLVSYSIDFISRREITQDAT